MKNLNRVLRIMALLLVPFCFIGCETISDILSSDFFWNSLESGLNAAYAASSGSSSSSSSSSTSSSASTSSSTSSSNPTITVVNNTGYNGVYLYVSPSTSSTWGSDVLGASRLANGSSFTVQLPVSLGTTSKYDIMLVDTDNDSYRKMGVTVAAGSRIVFTFSDFVGQSSSSSSSTASSSSSSSSSSTASRPSTTTPAPAPASRLATMTPAPTNGVIVPYYSSDAIGTSPLYPHLGRLWSGSGSRNDNWYNIFLNGGIELYLARGSIDGKIGCTIKNNLDYEVFVRVKIQSANGKTGYFTTSVDPGRYSYSGNMINPSPNIYNEDGFGDASIILLRTHDQNGRENVLIPGSFMRTW